MNDFKKEIIDSVNYYFDNVLNEQKEKFASLIIKHRCTNIFFLGIGKSYNQAVAFSDLLRSISFPSGVLDSSKLLHGDIGCVRGGDLAIVVSNSGNTQELQLQIESLKKKKVHIALLSSKNGKLKDLCDYHFIFPVEKELSVAFNKIPTLSSLNFNIFCNDILSVVIDKFGITDQTYLKNHINGSIGLPYKKVQDFLIKENECYFVLQTVSLKDAILGMNSKHIGCCCVFDEGYNMVGLVTDRDIRVFFENNDELPEIFSCSISQVMNKDFFRINDKNTIVKEVNKDYNYAPVFDRGKFIGIFDREFYNKA
tara:strand:+ start:820 stop:1752 length:933 start_codon:yes stop_codon:yes gene_type:complete